MSGVLWRALEYLQQGGWVMIPLGLCSVVMWALIVERLRAFRNLRKNDLSVPDAILAINGGAVVLQGQGLRRQLVRHFLQERAGILDLDRKILQQVAMHHRSGLSRFLAIIAVLAAVAPLLGLLGTVLGMIETFEVISLFGTGNAKAMASGISVALVTTQSGLLVAIPGLFLSQALMRQSSRLVTRLEETTHILERAIRQMAAA
jgi:biopolymer transport protein ExbB